MCMGVVNVDLHKNMIGLTSKPYVVEVEKGHIRRFAQAIGDNNPLYVDEELANGSIYEGIVAPLTFPIALTVEQNELPLELDTRRMLHGEQGFSYHRMLRPGDRLTCQMKVADIYEKEGSQGIMQFLVLDTEMKDEQGELVVVSRTNIIYRPLPV